MLAILLLASTVSCRALGRDPQPPMVPGGHASEQILLTPDGRERTYRLFVPDAVTTPVPLLIGLHGGTGSGPQFAENSGFDRLAAEKNFVAVYPNGIGARGTDIARTWNAGNCCGAAAKEGVDDVAFIDALITKLSAELPIDPGAVFVAGHSNGGIMAYRIACELAQRVAAIGVQSASLGVAGCAPQLPVSALQIHGTEDRNHPIGGGVGDRSLSRVSFNAAIDAARTLASADGCPSEPGKEISAANPEVVVTRWSPCTDGAEVEFVTVTGASHAWMGHESQIPALVGEAYMSYDSTTAIWDFLWSHRRAPSGTSGS